MREGVPSFEPLAQETVAQKEQTLLEQLNKKGRTALLGVVLGMVSLGFPGVAEAGEKSGIAFKPSKITARKIAALRLHKEAPPAPARDAFERIEELAKALEADIGPEAVKWILEKESVKSEGERRERLAQKQEISVSNLETLNLSGEGISNEEIEEIFNSALPKFLSRNIHSVSYRDELVEMHTVYGISKEADKKYEAAHISGGAIEITKGSEGHTRDVIIETLMHEAGHGGDWTRNELLTLEERLALCKKIVERVKSENRFRSGYVEMIQNDDARIQLRIKCAEYFPEIVEKFLSSGYVFLPKEDTAILEEVFSKTDPGFDFELLRARASEFGIRVSREKEEPDFVAEPLIEDEKEGVTKKKAVEEEPDFVAEPLVEHAPRMRTKEPVRRFRISPEFLRALENE